MPRTIIVGDIHGCLEQLQDLLAAVALQEGDKLVFIGDLIDKGPDSAGVVRHVRLLAEIFPVVLIQGNHEEKFFRLFEKPDQAPEYINNLAAELSPVDLAFLQTGVLYHRIKPNLIVVHGGFLPEHQVLPADPANLSKKEIKSLAKLMRTRFLRGRDYEQREVRIYDAEGVRVDRVKLNEGDPMPPIPEGCTLDVKINVKERGGFLPWKQEGPDDIFWADDYDGRFGYVVFGHESFETYRQPRLFPHAMGIDLGCVKGGRLAAVIYEEGNLDCCTTVPGLPADQAVDDPDE